MAVFQNIQRENSIGWNSKIQPSLEIGEADDEYEKEANSVADKVMKMGDDEGGKVQKMESVPENIAMMEEEEEMSIQKMQDSSIEGIASPAIESQLKSNKGSGQSLSTDVQHEMGSKIGADFSDVKVHTDNNAVQMNKELGAKAFTHGNDIYFNSNQYSPSSDKGKHLLAHELTHTVQQGAAIKKKIQKLDDETFEKGSGVGEAIANKTLVEVPEIMGKTLSIKGVLGKPDMEVIFKFEKAYMGTYQQAIGNRDNIQGIYIKLSGDVPDKEKYSIDWLNMLQIVTSYKMNVKNEKEVFEPEGEDEERKKRAARNDPNAKSQGSAVDTAPSPFANPFFTGPGGAGQEGGTFGNKPAIIWDAPGTNQKQTILKSVGKEFETYLMASVGARNVMLARVDWGYFIDENKNISFSPTPNISLIASDRMKDSVERWDKGHYTSNQTRISSVMSVVPETADLVDDPGKSTNAAKQLTKDTKVMLRDKLENDPMNKVDGQQFQWWYVSELDGAKTVKDGFMKSTDLTDFNK